MSLSERKTDDLPERVAVHMLRHLEWQREGFSLVFLFADVGPSMQLVDWLDLRLGMAGVALQRLQMKDGFVSAPEQCIDDLIEALPRLSAESGGVWFEAQRHPGDSRWNRARRLFLARLNERRFLLERDLKRPLVLVLPAHFRVDARAIAPDIWHVRALSEELRATSPGPPEVPDRRDMDGVASPVTLTTGRQSAHAEWERVMAGPDAGGSYLPTAWAAVSELLWAGRPADAQEVAVAAVEKARAAMQAQTSWSAMRDLSVSLDNLGRVAQAKGDWAQAETVYRESLDLSRQLVERLGGTPESLRDLSVSLDNLGRVARMQGDWAQAETAYRESLDLRRQLVERLGGTPESLRDLSVSLDNLGRVAETQGDWAQAETAYRESLDLSRQLVDRLGGTPGSLEDLALSLCNLGRLPAGDEAAMHEALGLVRDLVVRYPTEQRYGRLLTLIEAETAHSSSKPSTVNRP